MIHALRRVQICGLALAIGVAASAQEVRLHSGDVLRFTPQGAWRSATVSGQNLPLVTGAPVLTVCDVERGGQYHPLLGTTRAADEGVSLALESSELALKATLAFVPDGTAFKCRLRIAETSGKDRGLLVRFGVPVNAVGWRWWHDLDQARAIEADRLYEDAKPLRAFAALPEWKDKPDLRMGFNTANFCTVMTGPAGLCLAVPLDQPRLFRTAYDARQRMFSLTYDVALCADTAPPSEAAFEFELFACDPGWGMRAALGTYYQRHPHFFTKHLKDEGMWVAFTHLDTIDNPTEFGIAIQEGAGSLPYEDKIGVQSFNYYTHAGIYADVPNHKRGIDPTPSLERRIAAVEANLKRSTGRDGVYAECGLYDAAGKFSAEPGTVYGDVLAQFCLEPELFYGKWLLDRIDPFFAGQRKRGGELDGFYYDGLTTGINYRREHFRHASYPPSWDPVAKKPYLYNYFSSVEWARQVADKLHGMGKFTMMNGAMGASPFCAPYLDIMGAETGLNIPRTDFNFVRMICRHKTFATLLKGNYAKLTGTEIGLFMRRCLAYGVFPGFFDWPPSGLGPGGTYWDHPEYYERDRPLFRRYQPLVKAIAAAGWEPLTFARAGDERLPVERFGSMKQGRVFFTVLNDSTQPVRSSLRVPLAALDLPRDDLAIFDEIADRPLTGEISGDNLSVPLNLAPHSVALVHLARTNDFIAHHLDAARQLFRRAEVQRRADAGRPARPMYWHVTEERCRRDDGALCLRNDTTVQTASASQWVMLFQPEARPITIRARLKTRDLTGGKSGGFAMRAVVCYVDRQFTTRDPRTLELEPGDGNWANVEWNIEPARPVRSVQLVLQFNKRAGCVWFDNVSVRSADDPGVERVVDGAFDAWYEQLSPEQDALLAPAMAAAEKAIAAARPNSLKQLGDALAGIQSASSVITQNRLENPARRARRDLDEAWAHLALGCRSLAGIDGLEVLAPDIAVPGETVNAMIRLLARRQGESMLKCELRADGALNFNSPPKVGSTAAFQAVVPAAAKIGARHTLQAEATVALPGGGVLPLRAERTLTIVAPFAAGVLLDGVDTLDGSQIAALQLTNHLARAQRFAVAVSTPAGWTLRDGRPAVTIPARAAMSLPIRFVPGDRARPGVHPVTVSIRGEGGEETLRLALKHVPAVENRLKNQGFEIPAQAVPTHWSAWGGGCAADGGVKHSGLRSVRLHTDSPSNPVGASQSITLNQTRVTPLIVRGWSKAENISGGGEAGYCLYVDVYYTDGTKLYGQKVPFTSGTHDWQFGENRIATTRPVRTVTVYTMLRGSTGTAWFDDLFLAEDPASGVAGNAER